MSVRKSNEESATRIRTQVRDAFAECEFSRAESREAQRRRAQERSYLNEVTPFILKRKGVRFGTEDEESCECNVTITRKNDYNTNVRMGIVTIISFVFRRQFPNSSLKNYYSTYCRVDAKSPNHGSLKSAKATHQCYWFHRIGAKSVRDTVNTR